MRLHIAAAFLSGVLAQNDINITTPIMGLGSSYCTDTPDTECYLMGQPACCFIAALECPAEKPGCEKPAMPIMGGSICTYSPDMVCWPSTNGWPSCCDEDPSTCPSPSEFVAGVNPPCEEEPILGSSYCTDTPDTECYLMGQPACCFITALECPAEKPGCEEPSPILGSSYCTDTPDTECYLMGQPACCFIDALECPADKPGCEKPAMPIMDGSSICTYSPDMVCWPSTNGWPSCCDEDPSTCPSPSEFVAGVNPPCEEEPAIKTAEDEAPSSSTMLSLTLITLVGAHAVEFMAGMW